MIRLNLILLFGILMVGSGRSAETASFCSDVAPILRDNCLACHGPKKAEGGYRVDTYDEVIKAGDSGEAPVAVKPGEPSELLRRLLCDEGERMPADADPLPADDIAIIKAWIEAGGKFDGTSSSDPLALVIPASQYPDPPETYGRPIPITALCFTPDGSQLLVGGYHEVTVWNVDDAKLVRRMQNIGQRVFSIALSEDGKTVAVGCGEPGRYGELRLVNFDSGEVKGVVSRAGDAVLDAAFRPASNQLAIASADSLIRIVDVETLDEIRVIASHADWVNAVNWSDDGSRLVSASRDKTAKVFDAESGDLLASYSGHSDAVRGIAVLADGKQVVSTGADKKLHRWNLADGKGIAQVGIGGESFKLVRSESAVWVPSTDHRSRQFRLSDNQVATEYGGHSDWVLSLAVDPTGSRVASGAFDGEVRVWKLTDGAFERSWVAKP